MDIMWRQDFAAGLIAATVANTVPQDPKKKRKIFSIKDFMPDWKVTEAKEQSPEEQMGVMKLMAQALRRGR